MNKLTKETLIKNSYTLEELGLVYTKEEIESILEMMKDDIKAWDNAFANYKKGLKWKRLYLYHC